MTEEEPPRAHPDKPTLVAFHLPQFHRIPENDEWWGKGFTEWTNVTKAAPLFEGHYQPHLPTDMGFYDLRVRQTRLEQIEAAKAHGIDAFCYHYFWFSGRMLLETPLEDMLADREADMPFCLCWPNENWTRRWDGAEHEMLLEQRYSPDDREIFVANLVRYFNDRRYLRIEGKPVFLVYVPQNIPDCATEVREWRRLFRTHGIEEVYLLACLSHGNSEFKSFGFDEAVQFPPHGTAVPNLAHKMAFKQPFRGGIFSYPQVAEYFLKRRYADGLVYRCVVPSWDNTARAGKRANVLIGTSPENYEYWLNQAMSWTQDSFGAGRRMVFINAWNEWAEGAHLEPDRKFGRAYLEATKRVAEGQSRVSGYTMVPMPRQKMTRARLGSELRAGVLSMLRHTPVLYRVLRSIYRALRP